MSAVDQVFEEDGCEDHLLIALNALTPVNAHVHEIDISDDRFFTTITVDGFAFSMEISLALPVDMPEAAKAIEHVAHGLAMVQAAECRVN